MPNGVMKKRKNARKIIATVIWAVQEWVRNHDMVVPSLIASDSIFIVTGEKERKGKLLCTVPIRELHNDLVQDAESGRIPGLIDSKGQIVVSDTSL